MGASQHSLSTASLVLVHGDYWPGNLLWLRGRLVGVVDWEQPRLGDPAKDVATCRGDLCVMFGQDAADAFAARYEAASGQALQNMRFWDLFISTWAVPEMPEWAGAYRILGRKDLTTEVAPERIRNFRAPRSSSLTASDAENREHQQGDGEQDEDRRGAVRQDVEHQVVGVLPINSRSLTNLSTKMSTIGSSKPFRNWVATIT